MSGPLTSALLVMPRAGRVRLDLSAARAVPGVAAALEAADWGEGLDGVLPAGHVLAALAARDDAVLRKALAGISLMLEPVQSVTELSDPDIPHPAMTLAAARGVLDPLLPLCVTAGPDATVSGPLHRRIAASLARAAGAPVRVALSLAEANAALPQRPAARAAMRLQADAAALHLSLLRQGADAVTPPPLALALPLHFHGQGQLLDLPPALPALPEAPDPVAVALLELALQDHALSRRLDPLQWRARTLPEAARPVLLALAPGWSGPLEGRPAEASGRLRRGAGLAAGPMAAVTVALLADTDTGHVILQDCRIALAADAPPHLAAAVARGHGMALTEESAADPLTGALLAETLADFRLATAFTLPDIDVLPLAPGKAGGAHLEAWIAALVAAAIVTALRDATGAAPAHLPMTPDRVLCLFIGSGHRP